MRVYTRIPGRSSQVLTLLVWDMTAIPLYITLRQAEINDVDLVLLLVETHQKVVRLDVAMQKVLLMDVLDARDHLIR